MLMPFHSLREKKRNDNEGKRRDHRLIEEVNFFSLDDHYAQLLEDNYSSKHTFFGELPSKLYVD